MDPRRPAAIRATLLALGLLVAQSAGFVHGHAVSLQSRLADVLAASPVCGSSARLVAETPAERIASDCRICEALQGRTALADAGVPTVTRTVALRPARRVAAGVPRPAAPELDGHPPRAPPLPA